MHKSRGLRKGESCTILLLLINKIKIYKCGNDAYYIDFGSSEQYLLIREEE